MDAHSRNKSLFRAKLSALKKEKYNESDQPVCKVFDVVLKSEYLWDAHQASRKHHDAIANLKASAAALTRGTNSAGCQSNLLNRRPEDSKDLLKSKGEPSTGIAKLRPTPALPPDFFDGSMFHAGNGTIPLPGGRRINSMTMAMAMASHKISRTKFKLLPCRSGGAGINAPYKVTSAVFFTTWYSPPPPLPEPQDQTLCTLSQAIYDYSSKPFHFNSSLKKLLPSLNSDHILALVNLNPWNLSPLSILSFLDYLAAQPRVRLSIETYCAMAHLLCSHRMFPHAQSLVKFIVSRKGKNSASSIFESILQTRVADISNSVFDALIIAYADLGFIPDAIQCFRLIKKHNFPIPNRGLGHLLSKMSKMSLPEAAWGFYLEILDSGFAVSIYGFNILMHRFCIEGKLNRAQALFEEISKRGVAPTVVSFNTLINGYCRAGDIEEAFRLKRTMEERGVCPDVFTYSGWINGSCKYHRLEDANRLFQEMCDKHVVPNGVIFTSLIDGHCKSGRVGSAVEIYEQMLKTGVKPDLVTYNTLINGHCKDGDLEEAMNLFYVMSSGGLKPDKITYTTLIDGCCREGDIETALEIRKEMLRAGIEFDNVAFTALISGFCKQGRILDAERLLREMLKAGIKPDEATYTMVIDGFCKKGEPRMGFKLLKDMQSHGHRPGVVTYNALMNGFCKQGQMKNATVLLDAMLNLGVVPDDITYNILLEGHCKHGNLMDFDRLRSQKGVIQDYASYTSLISELTKSSKSPGNG